MFESIEWLETEEFDRKKAVLTDQGNCDSSDESDFLKEQWSFLQKLDGHFETKMGWSGFRDTGAVFLSDNLRAAKFFYCEVDTDQIEILPDLGLAGFLKETCPDYSIMIAVWEGPESWIGSILVSPEGVMATHSLKSLYS